LTEAEKKFLETHPMPVFEIEDAAQAEPADGPQPVASSA
jgi:hypothetical protein